MKDQAIVTLLHHLMVWLKISLFNYLNYISFSKTKSEVPCGWCTGAAEQHTAKYACRGQLNSTEINTHLDSWRNEARPHMLFSVVFNARSNITLCLCPPSGRAHSLIGKGCSSVDSNVITSQTIRTEKCLTSTADGMLWSLADSLEEAFFRDAPQRGRAATMSLLPVCQTQWVNSLAPEQNVPPHILIYLYFQRSI